VRRGVNEIDQIVDKVTRFQGLKEKAEIKRNLKYEDDRRAVRELMINSIPIIRKIYNNIDIQYYYFRNYFLQIFLFLIMKRY
jgi:hypothetical protein